MLITTRLKLSSYLSLIMSSIMIMVLLWSFGTYKQAVRQDFLADEIVSTIFERTILRDEYLIYGVERAKIQWTSKTETLNRLINAAYEQFKGKAERDILDEMRQRQDDTNGIFARIVKQKEASLSGAKNIVLEQRLTSQIIFLASTLYADAMQLQESTKRVVDLAYKRTVALSSIIVMVVVITTVLNSVLVNRILNKRLAVIQAGANTIADGNLDHRIVCQGSDELVALAETLNNMTDKVQLFMRQLETANKELEAFSYSISHDLRAPLRHINGFIELLGKQDTSSLNDKSQHYLRVIAESAKKMGTLIDDLLSFSRMGRAEMMQTSVSMSKLVVEAQNELQSDLAGKNIIWETDSLPEVYGDPAMLRQVFVNLISNAVKFSRDRDPIKIKISCSQANKSDETICRVSDNGVGFDMKYVDKLFGLFQRLHSPEEFEGTGVGLANVRRIIHRHGGRTWAEGIEDDGASFYFSLPNRKEQI